MHAQAPSTHFLADTILCFIAVITTTQVPVFIFELDRDEPVLIDQHYNARALEDLVMVVQNAANQ